jgi:hypothetical protein
MEHVVVGREHTRPTPRNPCPPREGVRTFGTGFDTLRSVRVARYLAVSMTLVAIGACGGGGTATAPSTTTAPATTDSAPRTDETCLWVDVDSFEELAGRGLRAEGYEGVAKPDADSGLHCSLYDSEDALVAGVTMFRFSDATVANQIFESDVEEFGSNPCSDGSLGSVEPVTVEGARSAILNHCGFGAWGLVDHRSFALQLGTRALGDPPSEEQMMTLVARIVATLPA